MFFAVDSEHNEDKLMILSLWLSLYKDLFFYLRDLGTLPKLHLKIIILIIP